mmetsp:Transcript_29982/g.95812  ORF Transcript_29982/g.95812 Transcript_29982/m.95812 type:complete len:392 (+) Transcript_29982:157-1332(+)
MAVAMDVYDGLPKSQGQVIRPSSVRIAEDALRPPSSMKRPLGLVRGPQMVFKKSVFQCHLAQILREADIWEALAHVLDSFQVQDQTGVLGSRAEGRRMQKQVSGWAYAFRLDNGTEGGRDEREYGAADRILYLLQRWGVTNAVLIYTRTDESFLDGELHLGTRKYKHIVDTAKMCLKNAMRGNTPFIDRSIRVAAGLPIEGPLVTPASPLGLQRREHVDMAEFLDLPPAEPASAGLPQQVSVGEGSSPGKRRRAKKKPVVSKNNFMYGRQKLDALPKTRSASTIREVPPTADDRLRTASKFRARTASRTDTAGASSRANTAVPRTRLDTASSRTRLDTSGSRLNTAASRARLSTAASASSRVDTAASRVSRASRTSLESAGLHLRFGFEEL